MDRNVEARKDLKAKGNAIKEPETVCDQCAKKVTDKLIKERLGGQEKNFCSKDCLKLFKLNTEEQRIISEGRTLSEIKFTEREIEYKQEQLKNGIKETRVLNTQPGQPTVILDGYVDGLKPAYIIENEIDRNKQLLKEQRKRLENIKKAREEDAAKPD